MNVKNIKKGFTLAELIIVVVIIAILAGILIPTFATVVKKNNKASDLSLIRSLNEALVIDSAENGKHENMNDALIAAKKCGFNVAKITIKSQKHEIVWDSVNDVFCYLNEGEVEYYPNSVAASKQLSKNDYRIWIISDKPSSSYSTYLYGVDAIASIDLVGTGLDVGDVKVYKISYTGASDARTVDIRTNWGELTINAPKDTVNHYNELNKLVVKAVASASFHSHGFIAEIVEFLQGDFVAESTATFGQTYEEVLTALDHTNVTNNIGTLQSLATVVFNQDAWDENGMSKNHEGRINEDPSKGTVHVHTEEIDPAVPATCTSTGLSQGSHCTVCGAVIVAQTEVAKLSHTIVIDPAVPATSGNPGLTQGSHCSVCGTIITKQEVILAE